MATFRPILIALILFGLFSVALINGGILLASVNEANQSIGDDSKLKSYAYSHKLELDDRFFPIDRRRAWQIIKRAGEKAGINKRVYCHLFRHSDAVERLRQTGNPKALQHHLGHSSPLMTMRYLSTLQQEDSLRIQQEVEFD